MTSAQQQPQQPSPSVRELMTRIEEKFQQEQQRLSAEEEQTLREHQRALHWMVAQAKEASNKSAKKGRDQLNETMKTAVETGQRQNAWTQLVATTLDNIHALLEDDETVLQEMTEIQEEYNKQSMELAQEREEMQEKLKHLRERHQNEFQSSLAAHNKNQQSYGQWKRSRF